MAVFSRDEIGDMSPSVQAKLLRYFKKAEMNHCRRPIDLFM